MVVRFRLSSLQAFQLPSISSSGKLMDSCQGKIELTVAAAKSRWLPGMSCPIHNDKNFLLAQMKLNLRRLRHIANKKFKSNYFLKNIYLNFWSLITAPVDCGLMISNCMDVFKYKIQVLINRFPIGLKSDNMATMKRVILIVLDSVGIGALPDAQAYNDEGANTLGNLYLAQGTSEGSEPFAPGPWQTGRYWCHSRRNRSAVTVRWLNDPPARTQLAGIGK